MVKRKVNTNRRREEVAAKIAAICDADKRTLLQYPASLGQVYTLTDVERLYNELKK